MKKFLLVILFLILAVLYNEVSVLPTGSVTYANLMDTTYVPFITLENDTMFTSEEDIMYLIMIVSLDSFKINSIFPTKIVGISTNNLSKVLGVSK